MMVYFKHKFIDIVAVVFVSIIIIVQSCISMRRRSIFTKSIIQIFETDRSILPFTTFRLINVQRLQSVQNIFAKYLYWQITSKFLYFQLCFANSSPWYICNLHTDILSFLYYKNIEINFCFSFFFVRNVDIIDILVLYRSQLFRFLEMYCELNLRYCLIFLEK